MSRCTRHSRVNCPDFYCRIEATRSSSDNAGALSIDPTSGDPNVGIGGGLTIDVADGDLGIQIAPGLSIDF